MKQKYLLFMALSVFFLKGTAQSNYAVTAIPFQPFSGTLASLTTSDDLYSSVIELPFPFDFYGVSYNQMIVSTNGYIDFRAALAGQNSPWSFSSSISSPSFPVRNSILGCYEDLNNPNGTGTITYGTYGVSPNRKFVVYFYQQPHFSTACASLTSSFQMILSEASNTIDVQLIDRQACPAWNAGSGVVGLINLNGTASITPPGRNTGDWNAHHEAWRFYRPGYYTSYSFVRCDDNSDGFQVFDLTVADNDLGGNYTFYETMTDAQTASNSIPTPTAYMNNSPFQQVLYAVGAGGIKTVTLSVIDCAVDADNDSVATADEDINLDTNLANDDTDFDGLPNYLDNDDDGDLVLTNVEYVFNKNATSVLDTDNDGIPNYLDKDDDGDGSLTFMEDYNLDGNPANDDVNTNSIPDYLETAVSLGVQPVAVAANAISIYPNPASDVLHVQNNLSNSISLIEVYAINGSKVKSVKATESTTTVSVTDLQSGVYFVKVITTNGASNYKFIKN